MVTVSIWTAFIVIARATADPARGGTLLPLDVVYARLWGAALVLLPWGWCTEVVVNLMIPPRAQDAFLVKHCEHDTCSIN